MKETKNTSRGAVGGDFDPTVSLPAAEGLFEGDIVPDSESILERYGPEMVQELEEKGLGHIVVVAGGVIPPVDYDYLLKETQSCSAVFGPGTRVVDAAMKVLDLIIANNQR